MHCPLVSMFLTTLVTMSLVRSLVSQVPCFLTTPCSASCGEGFRLLLPNKKAVSCMEEELQVQPCQEVECVKECRMGEWGGWSGCSSPRCVQGRRRDASDGGRECTGEEYEERDCWSVLCQGIKTPSHWNLFPKRIPT